VVALCGKGQISEALMMFHRAPDSGGAAKLITWDHIQPKLLRFSPGCVTPERYHFLISALLESYMYVHISSRRPPFPISNSSSRTLISRTALFLSDLFPSSASQSFSISFSSEYECKESQKWEHFSQRTSWGGTEGGDFVASLWRRFSL